MPHWVTEGAFMRCMFSENIVQITPTPKDVVTEGRGWCDGPHNAANVNDFVPLKNIPSFKICTSVMNPAAASTGSAPCTPTITGPWEMAVDSVLYDGVPALVECSALSCKLGITYCIKFVEAGEVHILIGDEG